MLSCSCDYDDDEGWYYYSPNDFSVFDRTRRKRCCSCNNLVALKAVCLEFVRARPPATDIEERICGEEVYLAPWFMCETCGETFLNLSDLGYCTMLGNNNIKEDLEDYWELTGFKPKNNQHR